MVKQHTKRTSIEVIIETPRGGRNKLKYDVDQQCLKLKSVLPLGMVFPYDFGFVPGTHADDGDPIDVLLLMDEPGYPGCHVEARLIGVIEADKLKDGKRVRNDRLIAVASESQLYQNLNSLGDMPPQLLREIEAFFVTYTSLQGKRPKILAIRGPARAHKLLKRACNHAHEKASR